MVSNRRVNWGRRGWALLGAAVLSISVSTVPAFASSAPGSASKVVRGSQSIFNVLDYGAIPDGVSDNTTAFASAIAAAQIAGGGTVMVPAGVYAFTKVLSNILPNSIKVPAGAAVTIEGAGSTSTACTSESCNSTWLVEHVPAQNLLELVANGSAVQGLTLDARTYGGGNALLVNNADNTNIQDDAILGAYKNSVIGQGAGAPFAVYYKGPPGATANNAIRSDGNQLSGLYIEDGVDNDGTSFSYQENASISDITYFGSRLALYYDDAVSVENVNYTPNTAECSYGDACNGFFITGPSQNITIDNFTTAGEGGIVGGPGQPGTSTNIIINNEDMTDTEPGLHLAVQNVNGMTITASTLDGIDFTNSAPSTGISVSGSTIGSLLYKGPGSVQSTFSQDTVGPTTFNDPSPAQVQATFSGDTYGVGPITVPFFAEGSNNGGTQTVSIAGAATGSFFGNESAGWYTANTANPSGTTFTSITGVPSIWSAAPSMSGTFTTSGTVTANPGSQITVQTPGSPTYSYQWNLDGSPISGATGSTLQLIPGDKNQSLSVTVGATTSIGESFDTSTSHKIA